MKDPLICDGRLDAKGGPDEIDCKSHVCSIGFIKCADMKTCVRVSFLCYRPQRSCVCGRGGVHGRGEGGMCVKGLHGKRGARGRWACVAEWACMVRGHAWQVGACIAEGGAWQRGGGHACRKNGNCSGR